MHHFLWQPHHTGSKQSFQIVPTWQPELVVKSLESAVSRPILPMVHVQGGRPDVHPTLRRWTSPYPSPKKECSFPSMKGNILLLTFLWKTFKNYAAAASKSLQSCPTLCDPIDGSPPGSSVPGILQARIYWSGLPFPSPFKRYRPYRKHLRSLISQKESPEMKIRNPSLSLWDRLCIWEQGLHPSRHHFLKSPQAPTCFWPLSD